MSHSASALAFLAAIQLLTLSPQRTYAAAEEAPQELSFEEVEYEKGLTFYKAGDYERAVASFVKVYRVSPNPNLVYNIARCFEELKRFDESADSYEEYLKLSPKASDAAQVKVTIKTLRSLARSQREAQEAKEAQAAQAKRGAQPQPPAQRSLKEPLGYAAIGVGAALLIGGIWSGAEAAEADDRRGAAQDPVGYNEAQSDMRAAAIRADLMFLGSAALSATGLVLILLSDDEPTKASSSAQLSLSPTQVSLTWQF